MSNFLTRIISAIIYAALFIFCIVYSKESYISLIALFGCICIWEFSKIINTRSILSFIPILLGSIYLKYTEILPSNLNFILLITATVYSLYLIVNLYDKKVRSRGLLNRLFLTLNYLIVPFLFLAFLPFVTEIYQPQLIVFVILIIWTNDSFAYIVGKNFGKRKLFERISPKKTIEGFFGGFIFSLCIGILIGRYTQLLSLGNWLVIATLVSVFGTYGDLVESKFKRLANVKDSGTIMPGHGGLLDRLDSLFFLAPFVYLYIHYCI
ncbi:phosphatidate cytidylyltransferase [Tenacibaculum jejuense]|uniref:Phosphatidate cytidylyltransferase n=1 Tax=Tenacibaculum jejuense TaxID=584609 RepID=A0A238U7J4_9FLAO|nr:phosphatidate cytidylyltransferase [Tenacibaculum jejuense]SNR15161.1 Phosphatidate cytidylyltransferase [Tenacibaculum jejuense]